MKSILKDKKVRTLFFATGLMSATLLFGGSANAQVSIGIRIGPPPPPRVVRVLPRRPSPDYVFVQGYWYPVGNHYKWRNGYWARTPFAGAYWVAPRYSGGQYIAGFWGGRRFDRDDRRGNGFRDRDHDRGRGRD